MSKKENKNPQSKKHTSNVVAKKSNQRGNAVKIIIILVLTFFCFSPSLKNDFTNWDDQQYIIENPLLTNLSVENIKEIFSSNVMGNYHPLSILSLAIDYQVYHLKAGGFHTTSILIHLLNVFLVFGFIKLLTRNSTIALITALLFGIHPMHVESVAWIAERKDVLYVFFYLASLCTYLLFIDNKERKWSIYFLTFLLFILSVLSKGQAVTLPIALLLIDFLRKRKFNWKLILEKIPFLIISIVMGIVAIAAQKKSGAITDIPLFPFLDRLLFASYSFIAYILKVILPIQLTAFYSYPLKISDSYPAMYYAAPFLLILIFFLIYRSYKTKRELIFGFSFFVLNIILLLQLLPVGGSPMSERYTYLSYIGIFFLIGSAFQSIWISSYKKLAGYKYIFGFALIVFTIALCTITYARNKIWKNSETLWTDVLKKNPTVVIAYGNRGSYYQKQGKLDLAMNDFNKALELKPEYTEALINRSDVYRVNGQYDLSIADCNKAISINKNLSGAYMNRGIAYCIVGRYDEAFTDFGSVISKEPKNANVYCNRGNLYDMKNLLDSALADYSMAISLKPEYTEAFYNRGKTYMKKQDYNSAINDFNSVIKNSLNYNDVYYFRSLAFKGKGDYSNALQDALTAQQTGKQIDPNYIKELQTEIERKK